MSLISLELSISGSEDSHDQLLFAFLRGYRFKKLIITTPGPRFLDFNQTLNQSLSSVETLTLCSEGLQLPARLLSSPPPFSALKCLEISIGENEYILSAFPWHQLDKLVLDKVQSTQLTADILQRCQSLVNCTIHIHQQGRTKFHVELPNLKWLRIANHAGVPLAATIANDMHAPLLQSLHLDLSSSTFEEVKALAESLGNLHGLYELQVNRFVEPVDLQRILVFLPSLCVVDVQNVSVGNEMSRHLKYGLIGSRLVKMHLGLGGIELRPDEVLDMIEARQMVTKEDCSKVVPFN